jgi:hypothetical protein
MGRLELDTPRAPGRGVILYWRVPTQINRQLSEASQDSTSCHARPQVNLCALFGLCASAQIPRCTSMDRHTGCCPTRSTQRRPEGSRPAPRRVREKMSGVESCLTSSRTSSRVQ